MSSESVPFRLTPNIQHFISPTGLEGPFTASMIAIGRALSEPSNEMHDYLAIFCKDELISWYQANRKSPATDENLKEYVNLNVDLLIKRTQLMSCKAERDEGSRAERICPLNQSILDLMNDAMNPLKLAITDIGFLPQL
jgi:transformation/transcription domain-associated protein